jgi:UDP-N-acetylglucosamine 2-epimerase (non-hydrolysing)
VDKPIFLVAGARPNFMKLAPVHRALSNSISSIKVVHTGQHYDYEMSQVFFDELSIPTPDYYLDVGSDTHARQTAKIMIAFEELCIENEPCLVLVFGDVNSTVACSLVASKMHIPVAHVEAGLRSRNLRMPEEINRILTDHMSDLLFTTSEIANRNLQQEGIDQEKIHFVGNVMIDNVVQQSANTDNSNILETLELKDSDYDLQ